MSKHQSCFILSLSSHWTISHIVRSLNQSNQDINMRPTPGGDYKRDEGLPSYNNSPCYMDSSSYISVPIISRRLYRQSSHCPAGSWEWCGDESCRDDSGTGSSPVRPAVSGDNPEGKARGPFTLKLGRWLNFHDGKWPHDEFSVYIYLLLIQISESETIYT